MQRGFSAERDERLSARVLGAVELVFAGGHVRAGSGLAWYGERLAVVQDDTRSIALVEPTTGRVECVKFGPKGGDAKHDKLDLEALVSLDDELIALGSGSTPRRTRIVRIRAGRAEVVDASAFYASLRETTEFSGSELNIEGATRRGDQLVLFQRGNGKPVGSLEPVNASASVDLAAFLAHLSEPRACAPPPLGSITRYQLGTFDGARLGFTDAAAVGEVIYFLAAAEMSADTYADGRVTGTVLGVIEPNGRARWTPLLDSDGRPLRAKAEGLALAPGDAARAFVVLDTDDTAVPAKLCSVALRATPLAGAS